MAKNKTTPKLRFNCYLLSETVTDPAEGLRAKYRKDGAEELKQITPSSSAPDGTVAFLGKSRQKTPPWAERLKAQLPELGDVFGATNRLVIMLPVNERWFAVCFGYGSSTLDWDKVDANFGLRVAARDFDPNEVIQIHSRRIDATARTQTIQVPRGSDLSDFGISTEGEFVRKLSGRIGTSSKSGITGAVAAGDSIAFKAETSLKDVSETLESLLKIIEKGETNERFSFIDALTPIRDSSDTARDFYSRLAAEILLVPDTEATSDANESVTHILEVVPPSGVDLDRLDRVELSRKGKESVTLEELTVPSLRIALKALGVRRGKSFLKDVKAIALDDTDSPISELRPITHWLIYEFGGSSWRAILTLGHWFKLDRDYSKKLDRDLAKITDVTARLGLPPMLPTENEGDYNERAATTSSSLLNMDKNNIRLPNETAIEACDLFSTSGDLICVKKYKDSQTLSHLFSQGTVSVSLLRDNDDFKDEFDNRVRTDPSFASAASRAPQSVTYAIAIDPQRDIPGSLPTFSKVNLRIAATSLRQAGVAATIAKIDWRK